MTALCSEAAVESFAFGPFLLIPEQLLLVENERAVRIGRRAFDLLTALVRSQGQVVSKEELVAHAWPGLVVEEGNLKVNIAALRRVLHEDSGPPRYIATVVGRGYRFIATVRPLRPQQTPGLAPGKRVGNLPLVSKRIFGRESVISSLLHDLQSARLVSIVGPGGAGKTTVVLAVAERAAGAFRGGAWFVDLSVVQEASGIHEVIQTTLLSSLSSGSEGERLLVLDNCEHLIDAVATCADQLLTGTTDLKLITTSREPLCIRGERVRRLHGLGLPPDVSGLRATDALVFPAVQLFAARATEKHRSFKLDDSNARDVAAICHRLDGLALAIERVAQRVGALGSAGMLEHLDRRFHMFDGYHEGPARHRTLTANVDASYALLSSSEQKIMRRLSIFADAFGLESACLIAGADDLEPTTVIEGIANLVAKSLLSAEAREGEMLYRQAHLTRAFASEKLTAHGELSTTQQRYREHLGTLGKREAQDE